MSNYVFIHGWASDSSIFIPIENILEEKGHSVTYIDYSNKLNFKDYVFEAISKLAKEDIPIGWSMGGMLLLENVAKFNRLILVSSCLQFDTKKEIIESMIAGVKNNKKRELRRFYSLAVYDKKNYLYKELAPVPEYFDDDYLIEGLNYLLNTKIEVIDNMQNIDIIHGTEDQIVNYSLSEKVKAKFKNANLFRIKSGHIPFLEATKPFVEAIIG